MAIVTAFFDQQKAGEINSIINNNFKNVAKYIPIHFDSLTTIERLNLGEDWRENGKLVYDIDQEKVFIWDEASVDWVEHLIEAKDSFARALATENQKKSFASVTLTENCELIFKNALGDTVATQLLTSDKIQYDSTDTIFTKIGKLLDKDTELETSISNINNTIGQTPLPTNAQTLTGAIDELHGEIDENTTNINDIMNGDFSVPSAQHAVNADLATNSENLGGNPPSFYAKQTDLDDTNQNVSDNTAAISQNTESINNLQTALNETNSTVESNWQDYLVTKQTVTDNDQRLDVAEADIASLKGAVIPKGSVPEVDEDDPDETLTQYIYDTYFGGIIYKGKTTLTEGNEQTELTTFVGGTPQNNWAVLDETTQNTWVYNSTDSKWESRGQLIKTGWAVRSAETSDMWVYESDNSSWVNFGGSFEIKIATTSTAGTVMATDDVAVNSATGAMSVPKLNNKAEKSEALGDVVSAQNAQNTGTVLTLKTVANTNKSTITLYRARLGHRIQNATSFVGDRTTIQFKGNVTVTDDGTNDKIVVDVTGGQGAIMTMKLVDEDYTITLSTSSETYTTPVLSNFNKDTDVIKLFMNGAYIPKSNYTITVNDSNVATIRNLNHSTAPWVVGWELGILVTRVVTTTKQ